MSGERGPEGWSREAARHMVAQRKVSSLSSLRRKGNCPAEKGLGEPILAIGIQLLVFVHSRKWGYPAKKPSICSRRHDRWRQFKSDLCRICRSALYSIAKLE